MILLGSLVQVKGFGFALVSFEEAVDGIFKLLDGSEHAAFEASLGELGEEAFDGVEP